MIWQGQELHTAGDIMRIIIACETPKEAQAFMALYRTENPHADENVGYMSGYYDTETMERIQTWCQVRHPIFGGTQPTMQEAFATGQRIAQRLQD